MMETENLTALETVAERPSKPEGVDWLHLALVLARGKRIIVRCALAGLLLAAVTAYLVLSPVYTASAVFLPPQVAPGSSSMTQLAAQMSGAFGSLGSLAGIKNPGDIYVGVLGSRTVADSVIRKFDLMSVYKTKRMSDTVKVLKKNSKFISGKDTLITITVEDHDPQRAMDIANAYLDFLREQNGRLALTEAAQKRLFFEQQLEREKNALGDAEVDLKRTQEKTGLIVPVGQAQVAIETMAQVRAQITSRQVELDALRQGATEENPTVVRLQSEVAGLQAQLRKMENGSAQTQPGDVQPPAARVPALALEYVRKQREVKYHEILFELIARQYETARLDEAREAPVLQVVDRAILPDKKSGPPRVLMMLGGLLLGALAGAAWVMQRAAIENMKSEPETAAKLSALRDAASRRPRF